METLCFKNRHPELKNNLQGRPNKSTTLRDAISFCDAKDLIQDLQYLINTEQRMEILRRREKSIMRCTNYAFGSFIDSPHTAQDDGYQNNYYFG